MVVAALSASDVAKKDAIEYLTRYTPEWLAGEVATELASAREHIRSLQHELEMLRAVAADAKHGPAKLLLMPTKRKARRGGLGQSILTS